MRIPRKDFEFFLTGRFAFLPPRPRPRRGRDRHLLARVIPSKLPGLGAEIRSSHSIDRLYRHLFLKGTQERLNKNEKEILTILALRVSEPRFLVIEKLLQLQDSEKEERVLFGQELREIYPDLSPDPRNLQTFAPEVFLYRVYVDSVSVHWPQRKRGHTDQGTLSSTPSWKEQMVEENEDGVKWNKLLILLRKFPRTANLRLRLRLDRKSIGRTDESQGRTKRRKSCIQ